MSKAPFLISISGKPGFQLIMWNWEKSQPKIVAMHKIQSAPKTLYSIFSHPKEDDFYCIVGDNFFRTYKFVNNDFMLGNKHPF